MLALTSPSFRLGLSGSAFVSWGARMEVAIAASHSPVSAPTASSTSVGLSQVCMTGNDSMPLTPAGLLAVPMSELSVREENVGLVKDTSGSEVPRSTGIKMRGKWTAEEHERFLEAMARFGNDWKRARVHISTRTAAQIRSHAQKYYEHMRKKEIRKARKDPRYRNALFVVTHEYWHVIPSFPSARPIMRPLKHPHPSHSSSSSSAERCLDRPSTTPSLGSNHPQDHQDPLDDSASSQTPLQSYEATIMECKRKC